jgi:hypothetical protein
METRNEATKRSRTAPIAQDSERQVRQPEQEQHMTIGDTQASAEDCDNVAFVPPVLPALAVPAIIHERADFAVYTSFTGEEALHVYDVTVTGVNCMHANGIKGQRLESGTCLQIPVSYRRRGLAPLAVARYDNRKTLEQSRRHPPKRSPSVPEVQKWSINLH